MSLNSTFLPTDRISAATRWEMHAKSTRLALLAHLWISRPFRQSISHCCLQVDVVDRMTRKVEYIGWGLHQLFAPPAALGVHPNLKDDLTKALLSKLSLSDDEKNIRLTQEHIDKLRSDGDLKRFLATHADIFVRGPVG